MTSMPRRVLFSAIAAVAFGAVCSAAHGQPAPTGAQVLLSDPPAGKGQIVFYRKPMFSLVPFNWIVRENKTVEICEMVAGTYCVAPADPGKHTYEVHSEVANDLTLEVDAGETYYVIGGIAMGLIVNHPTISPATKAEFDAISPKLQPKSPIPATTVATAPATGAATATPASTAPAPAATPASPTDAKPAA